MTARTWTLIGGGGPHPDRGRHRHRYSVKSASAHDAVGDSHAVVDRLATLHGLPGESACSTGSDLELLNACADLIKGTRSGPTRATVATASLVTAGVLGAATLTTYLLLQTDTRHRARAAWDGA